MVRRSQFPRAKATPAKPVERRPRDWRGRTHVLIDAGQKAWNGEVICDTCAMIASHPIHDLTVSTELSEVDRRRLGERE